MRILPHATSDAVKWGEVEVTIDGVAGATSWDYTSQTTITTSVDVDPSTFLPDTGLPSLEQVAAIVTVDCSSTGRRFVEHVPLVMPRATVQVDIPPGVVAKSLSVSRALVLGVDRQSKWGVARRAGDRLNEADAMVIHLEGSGGRFPIDAVDFAPAGLPPGAVWNLDFQPEGWDDLYLGVVRLRVNTAHEASEALLQNKHSDHKPFTSVLRVDMIVQMLVRMIPLADELETTEHDSDSVAGVLADIVSLYAGLSLPHALARARDDLPGLVSTLQSKTLYLTRKS